MNRFGRLQRQILTALADGQWRNAGSLAAICGVEDDAIWAAVKRLREKGINIESEIGRSCSGYRLLDAVPALVLEPRKRDPRTPMGEEIKRLRGMGFSREEAQRILDDHATTMARRMRRAA
ncbi:MAG: HTH domain-containing protein [Sphingobium sp.]|nr:HTH domain-containing protein [Sphingobium sp.]